MCVYREVEYVRKVWGGGDTVHVLNLQITSTEPPLLPSPPLPSPPLPSPPLPSPPLPSPPLPSPPLPSPWPCVGLLSDFCSSPAAHGSTTGGSGEQRSSVGPLPATDCHGPLHHQHTGQPSAQAGFVLIAVRDYHVTTCSCCCIICRLTLVLY